MPGGCSPHNAAAYSSRVLCTFTCRSACSLVQQADSDDGSNTVPLLLRRLHNRQTGELRKPFPHTVAASTTLWHPAGFAAAE